jgi:hypothetical protein
LGIAGAVVVVLVLADAAAAAASGWAVQTTQNPGTENNYLYGVSCPSAKACIAVGNYDPVGGGVLLGRWSSAGTARRGRSSRARTFLARNTTS